MKKTLVVLVSLLVALLLAGLCVAAVKNGRITVKAGDEIYVCGCGAKCGCMTVGRKAGNCACGNTMSKVKVTRVEGDKAYYKVDGKEESVALVGKYSCGCGKGCNCDYISQKPAKCGCGQPMKKVE